MSTPVDHALSRFASAHGGIQPVDAEKIKLSLMNARSINKKFAALVDHVRIHDPSVVLVPETWEKARLANKIENF